MHASRSDAIPNATVQAGGPCGPQAVHASRPDAKPNNIIVRWRGAREQTRPSSLRELCGRGAFARRTSVQLELMRPPRHGNRAKSNPETALYLLTASPRARAYGGGRSRAPAPCATSRRCALRVPRHRRKISAFHEGFIHLQRYSRSSVLLSVGSLVPARASSRNAVSAARLRERVRRRRRLGCGADRK